MTRPKAIRHDNYMTDGIIPTVIIWIIFVLPIIFLSFFQSIKEFTFFILVYSWALIYLLITVVVHLAYPNKPK